MWAFTVLIEMLRFSAISPAVSMVGRYCRTSSSRSLSGPADGGVTIGSSPVISPSMPSPVWPLTATEGKVAFAGPVDAKLLRGIDGHVYALDFIRSQPVDCFWIQAELKRDAQSAGSSQFILRPELIEHIITQKAELEARGQQIKELLDPVKLANLDKSKYPR